MASLQMRRALPDDAQALTDLMQASRAYEGSYRSILDGYAITKDQIARDAIYLAEQNDQVVGFYSLTLTGDPELDLLFVADRMQGSGLGKMLIEHMKEQARQRGIGNVKIVSHPPSVGFYQKMGATIVGAAPPTKKVTWERPILSLAI